MNVNLEHNEGLYLIHTRELHTLQKNIYKIGRSYKLYDRIKQYPKTSKIMFIINCKESVLREKNLILLFKSKFIQKLDYGTEYFQGDIDDMIKEIFNYIYNNKTIDSKIVAKVDNKVAKIAKNKKVAKVAKVANVVNIDNKVVKKVAKKVDNVVNIANKVAIIDTFDKVSNKVNNADNIDTVDNKVNRTCPKCNYVFKFPNILKKHFKNSFHCLLSDEDINLFFNPTINNIKCNICLQTFSQKCSLYRHQRNMKCGKIQFIENINNKKIKYK